MKIKIRDFLYDEGMDGQKIKEIVHSLKECKFWCYYNILMFIKIYI